MVERGKNVVLLFCSSQSPEPEFGVANSNNSSRRNIRNIVLTNFLFNCGCPKHAKWTILTHLAYIANGKKRVIMCNNFTGRISVTLLCGICDVSYPTKQR